MDNRKTFEQKAIRFAEKKIHVPSGWWGDWRHVHGPHDVEVCFTAGGGWLLRQHGKIVSKHDSRALAISKARKLTGEKEK